jgi:hypothetical protein
VIDFSPAVTDESSTVRFLNGITFVSITVFFTVTGVGGSTGVLTGVGSAGGASAEVTGAATGNGATSPARPATFSPDAHPVSSPTETTITAAQNKRPDRIPHPCSPQCRETDPHPPRRQLGYSINPSPSAHNP